MPCLELKFGSPGPTQPASWLRTHVAIFYLHELFDSANEWLRENSYQNILGT